MSLAVEKHRLAAWLTPGTPWLAALLARRQPAVYTALLTPEIQMGLFQLAEPRPAHRWDAFFYQLKAQELVLGLTQKLSVVASLRSNRPRTAPERVVLGRLLRSARNDQRSLRKS